MNQLRSLLSLALALTSAALLFGGCAEPVKDVNRVQGNYMKKADLEGEWYMLTTVVGVPPTRMISFPGETGKMERVRFEFHEDELVAYRAYPLLEGADAPSTRVPFDGQDAPVAAWPVESHFDIQREYNSSTGEQGNVLDENTSDRKWFEREYVRVDWSASDITNFDFVLNLTFEEDFEWTGAVNTAYASFVSEEEGGPDAFYREFDDAGATKYFDVLGKWLVEPNLYFCVLGWWGYGAYDCASADVTMRTSFARVPAKQTYEAFHYDDHLMSRFGYFRSEMYTFDEARGVVDSGRKYMINRHNLWETAYDDAGALIPIPKRKPRTIPYYLSPTFPDDELLDKAAVDTMAQWDVAGRKAVAAAQGKALADVGSTFTLCHNPVKTGDHAACGAAGFAPRFGDLRYSVLHWVDTETMEGLLGYGPSATDPLTGEIVSGKAHVYGSAVNHYATYALDVIRFFNDDLDEQALVFGKHFTDRLREQAASVNTKPVKRSEKLAKLPLSARPGRREGAEKPIRSRAELRPYDPHRAQAKIDAARARGASPMRMNDEIKRSLSHRLGMSWDKADPQVQALLDPAGDISVERLQARRRFDARLRGRLVEMTDLIEPNIQGLVEDYAGRTDYDQIWKELRADIFASTAEHEVGHTVGLRHNFQGSYDSLNYPEAYWKLREENLDEEVRSLEEMYAQMELTTAQKEGHMRQHQYSSIMDYGNSWANDIVGLGKYDEAAVLFGYTAGAYEATGDRCKAYPHTGDDKACVAQLPGFIEVFDKTRNQLKPKTADESRPRAGDLLTRQENGHFYEDPGLPSVTILERFHYTTFAQSFPSLESFSSASRKPMNYVDYLDQRDAAIAADAEKDFSDPNVKPTDRLVRVPYMFCSDEWEGGLLSCRVFDQGADPMELTQTIIDDYRAYYWFVNFRRDRVGFDVDSPLYRYWGNTFLPLTDIYQHWYLTPTWDPNLEFDELLNTTFFAAIHTGFNLFSEALSTPPYGTYCQGVNGNLIFLTDSQPEAVGQNESQASEPSCAVGGDKYSIAPGVGRRRFSRYDNHSGYFLESKVLEAGHYWTELAVLLSIFDPDAYVIGAEGDAGTYAISYYDFFGDEMEKLLNAIVSKDYRTFAPRAQLLGTVDDAMALEIAVRARPAAPWYFYDFNDEANYGYIDPETGADLDAVEGKLGGSASLCDNCNTDTDCAGYSGLNGGVFCQVLSGESRCLVDCFSDAASCPDGTACYKGNCIPSGMNTCENFQRECGEDRPLGRCPVGETCELGACVKGHFDPIVETDATFMVDTDIFWFGFIYSTSGFSTRFNDNFNVFRPGTQDEVDSDPEMSERVEFTDPIRGISYAAVQPRCDLDNALNRETRLCGACIADMQCDGFTGTSAGTRCVGATANEPGRCLQRCTRGQAECGEGYTCGPDQVCEADDGCPVPASRCELNDAPDTGAVQLIKRANAMAADVDHKMRVYWASSGDEPDAERISSEYWRAKYQLENHLDLLETLRATFEIFGGVF